MPEIKITIDTGGQDIGPISLRIGERGEDNPHADPHPLAAVLPVLAEAVGRIVAPSPPPCGCKEPRLRPPPRATDAELDEAIREMEAVAEELRQREASAAPVEAPSPAQPPPGPPAAPPSSPPADSIAAVEARVQRVTAGRSRWVGFVSAWQANKAAIAAGHAAQFDTASALMSLGAGSAYGDVRAYLSSVSGLGGACIDALQILGATPSEDMIVHGKEIAVEIRAAASALRLIDLAGYLEAGLESERPLTGKIPTGPTVAQRDDPRSGYLHPDSEPAPFSAPVHLLNQPTGQE